MAGLDPTKLLRQTVEQVIGTGVGFALTPPISVFTQPILNELWSTAPTVPLTPDILAAMVVQGIRDQAAAAREAALSGINDDRFADMVRVNGSPPGAIELFDLWDRGVIGEQDVDRGLLQSRLKPEWVKPLKALAAPLLSVSDLAEMVVQSVLGHDAAAGRAALMGWTADDFALLTRLAGSPPGPETVLSMWDRGIIAEADVDRALLQSRLKPEWVDAVKRSRLRVPSVSQAANAVVRERITLAEGERIAAQNGYPPEAFHLMVNEIGRPIAIGESLTLVNRGVMTEAQFREVVARSDVRTEYTEQLFELRHRLPSITQVRQLVASGSMTDAVAKDVLVKSGYSAEIADGVIHGAKHGTKSKHRELSVSIVETLFDAGMENHQWAVDALHTLGYDDDATADLLNLLQIRRLVAEQHRALNVVRAKYVAHAIDRGEAVQAVDNLVRDPAAREQLLALWDDEREANVRRLTPSQIGQAVKYSILDDETAVRKWVEIGYPEDDARILLQIVHKGPTQAAHAPVAP